MRSLIRRIYSYLINIKINLIFLFNNNTFELKSSSILLGYKLILKGKNNHVSIGKNCTIRNTTFEIRGNNNRIEFHDFVKVFENAHILFEGNNSQLIIMDKTTIGSVKLFLGESNTKIHIGRDCMLSTLINIDTSDFHSIIDKDTSKRINPPKDVIVFDRVWIGHNVTINKGTIIQENSMIATKSVLTGKLFPPNVIIAGIPGKIVKENIIWSRDKIEY